MDIAEDVKGTMFPQDVWDAASYAVVHAPEYTRRLHENVCSAILAEREASEARMLELLKDPVAVRLNWMRGGINADSIIAEERERCAKIADSLVAHVSDHDRYRSGMNAAAVDIAYGIRSGASTP